MPSLIKPLSIILNKRNDKKLNKKYAELMNQVQQSTGWKEVVRLLHKAAKLKNKFDSYEMMKPFIDLQ